MPEKPPSRPERPKIVLGGSKKIEEDLEELPDSSITPLTRMRMIVQGGNRRTPDAPLRVAAESRSDLAGELPQDEAEKRQAEAAEAQAVIESMARRSEADEARDEAEKAREENERARELIRKKIDAYLASGATVEDLIQDAQDEIEGADLELDAVGVDDARIEAEQKAKMEKAETELAEATTEQDKKNAQLRINALQEQHLNSMGDKSRDQLNRKKAEAEMQLEVLNEMKEKQS